MQLTPFLFFNNFFFPFTENSFKKLRIDTKKNKLLLFSCSDFDSDELEILARSGDEDSDDGFMDDGKDDEDVEGDESEEEDEESEEEDEEAEESNEDEDSDEADDINDKGDIVKNFELSDSD